MVKPANSNPGATTQLTSAQPSPARAACHSPAATMHCGRCPASTSGPRTCHCVVAEARQAMPSSNGAPACQHQISSASTQCQCDCCPTSSKKWIAVIAARSPGGAKLRNVSRYQPPSGCGFSANAAMTSAASLFGGRVRSICLCWLGRLGLASFLVRFCLTLGHAISFLADDWPHHSALSVTMRGIN